MRVIQGFSYVKTQDCETNVDYFIKMLNMNKN